MQKNKKNWKIKYEILIDFVIVPCDRCFLPLSSLQFSCSVISDSLRLHELQHARPPCLSPTRGIHSNSRPSSRWCHPSISSSVVPFSSCLQTLPASESFPMSQLFAWGGQSTGVSASASFLPKNTQGWKVKAPHISVNNSLLSFKWANVPAFKCFVWIFESLQNSCWNLISKMMV